MAPTNRKVEVDGRRNRGSVECALTQQSLTDYVCLDCDLLLPDYGYGEEQSLYDHVYTNHVRGGTCRYIRKKYEHDQKGLLFALGTARFRRGLVAFPEYIFYGLMGYVELANVLRCIVCATERGKKHPPVCATMSERMATDLRKLKLHEPPVKLLFVTQSLRSDEDDDLECDGVNVTGSRSEFHALGDKANMHHVRGTVDRHSCNACATSVAAFEEGDTLLREHVYHVYNEGNTCAYLERVTRHAERRTIVAEERYRKGFAAFADELLRCDNGTYDDRCVVCAASKGGAVCRLGPPVHKALCESMSESLKSILVRRKLI